MCPANTVLPFVRANRGQTPNKGREFAVCDIIHEDGRKCPVFKWKWPNRTEDPALNPFLDPLLPPGDPNTYSQLPTVVEMEETMLRTAIAASLEDQGPNHVPSITIPMPTSSSYQATSISQVSSSSFTTQSSSFITQPLQTTRNSNLRPVPSSINQLSPPTSTKTRLICSELGCVQSGNTRCLRKSCRSHCIRKGGCRQHPAPGMLSLQPLSSTSSTLPLSSTLPPSYTQATISPTTSLPASDRAPDPIPTPNASQEALPVVRAPKFFTLVPDTQQQSIVQQTRDEHRELALATKATQKTLRSSVLVCFWTSEEKPYPVEIQVPESLSAEGLTISRTFLDAARVCEDQFEYYRPQVRTWITAHAPLALDTSRMLKMDGTTTLLMRKVGIKECEGLQDYIRESTGPGINPGGSRLVNPPSLQQRRRELSCSPLRNNSRSPSNRSRSSPPTRPPSSLQRLGSRHQTPPPPVAQKRSKISPLSSRFTASPSPNGSTLEFAPNKRARLVTAAQQRGYTSATKWPAEYFARDIIDFYREMGDNEDLVKRLFNEHFPLVTAYPRALVYSHHFQWKDAPQDLLDELYTAVPFSGPCDDGDAQWKRLMKVVPDRYQALQHTRRKIKRELDQVDQLAAVAHQRKSQPKKSRKGGKVQLVEGNTLLDELSSSSLGSDDSVVREVRRRR
ncbi:hypothetical protein PM082_018838 [Marasmius tenuissimus]|nr:hypothetical protein PM082_018838 [Marasmius tenuissimus]